MYKHKTIMNGSKVTCAGPVQILTISFHKSKYEEIILEGIFFIWKLVIFVLLLMKSSHVENLRNANEAMSIFVKL